MNKANYIMKINEKIESCRNALIVNRDEYERNKKTFNEYVRTSAELLGNIDAYNDILAMILGDICNK